MKITVLIPSDEYRNYAGCRIRYGRLSSRLAELNTSLELQDIRTFDPQDADCDVLLISKCHDSRSVVAAASMAARGCRVGIDIFDDYFSDSSDSRMLRFRNWLSQILPHCQFALCSTPVLAGVIARYRSNLPVHILNDPAPRLSAGALQRRLRDKLRETQQSRLLKLAWFGVGDNPFFEVGLSDLAANCSYLLDLADESFALHLTVLTNERALTARGLELIEALPVRTNIREWNERREIELLQEAFACFLPVNAHPFSVAKSLNRAVTALSAGCQVISVGYPLYERLDELIYREPGQLLSDLEAGGAMRHSPDHLDRFLESIATVASPEREAQGLVDFLEGVGRPQGSVPELAIVHGHATNGLAHKWVQSLKGLSIASPFCKAALGFDVIFRKGPGGLTMLVSDKASKRLLPGYGERLSGASIVRQRGFRELNGGGKAKTAGPKHISLDDALPSLALELGSYARTMHEIQTRTEEAFGPQTMIFSEESRLPFYRTLGAA